MRLIDADEVKAKMESTLDMQDLYLPYRFQNILNETPTVHPVKRVKHGEWIPKITDFGTMIFRCSACQKFSDVHWAYCPKCGAMMDGVETE